MKMLFSSILINQIINCYISCFMHQSGSMILGKGSSKLYKIDSAIDVVAIIVRISFSLLIDWLPVRVFRFIYLFSSFMMVISTIFFTISLSSHNENFYIFAWALNRVFGAFIAAIRDYLIYQLSYSYDINIPIIKSLKSLGNLITLIHTFLFISNMKLTSYLLISSSLLNLLFTIITLSIMKRISHFKNNSTNSNESEDNLTSSSKLDSFSKLDKEDSNTSSNLNQKTAPNRDKSFKSVNYQTLSLIFTITFLMSLFTLSDHVMYLEAPSISLASSSKFVGQTIIGFIYSLLFRNNIYISVLSPLIIGISYLLMIFQTTYTSSMACVLWGITMTLRNASYIIIPRYIAVNYNQLYQIAAFLGDSIAIFIACCFQSYILRFFAKYTTYKIFSAGSFICYLIIVFIFIWRNKKEKDKNKVMST